MKKLFEKMQINTKNLLNSDFVDPKKFPKTRGVYLIYDDNDIIYVGKAKQLNRRINSDHISGENKITTSTFRRKLCKKFNQKPGQWIRKWICNNCKFKYIEVEDPDLCDATESFLILYLRAGGKKLLNS
ncbi:MAG: GIY-YIG nuclease family protein [bacterium]